MKSIKLGLAGLFLLLVLIVAVQNAEVVALQFLVWEVEISLVLLVLLLAGFGLLAGYLVGRVGRGGGPRA